MIIKSTNGNFHHHHQQPQNAGSNGTTIHVEQPSVICASHTLVRWTTAYANCDSICESMFMLHISYSYLYSYSHHRFRIKEQHKWILPLCFLFSFFYPKFCSELFMKRIWVFRKWISDEDEFEYLKRDTAFSTAHNENLILLHRKKKLTELPCGNLVIKLHETFCNAVGVVKNGNYIIFLVQPIFFCEINRSAKKKRELEPEIEGNWKGKWERISMASQSIKWHVKSIFVGFGNWN